MVENKALNTSSNALLHNERPPASRTVDIYQMPNAVASVLDVRFEGFRQLAKRYIVPTIDMYAHTYQDVLDTDDTLDTIFDKFNNNLPSDFTGHSLSVGDIIVIGDNGKYTASYVDTIGFVSLAAFAEEHRLSVTEQTGISKHQPNFITRYDVLKGVRAHDTRMINALISPNKDIEPHKGVSFDGIHFTGEYCWSAVHFPQWVKLVDSVNEHSFRYICDEDGNFLNWSGNVAVQRSDIPRCQMEEADAMEM